MEMPEERVPFTKSIFKNVYKRVSESCKDGAIDVHLRSQSEPPTPWRVYTGTIVLEKQYYAETKMLFKHKKKTYIENNKIFILFRKASTVPKK